MATANDLPTVRAHDDPHTLMTIPKEIRLRILELACEDIMPELAVYRTTTTNDYRVLIKLRFCHI